MSIKGSKGSASGPKAESKTSSEMASPPVRTGELTPFHILEDAAQSIKARALKDTNPVTAQMEATRLDNLLRDCAIFQQTIGRIRKEVGGHIAMLRMANPKGKPDEGTIATTKSGRKVIYIAGSWSPYNGDQPPDNKEN